jgi:hypothetical protein
MSRKREPVAEIGADDYRIVRHTHDLDLAKRLMRAALIEEYVRDMGALADDDYSPDPGQGRQTWVRVQYALPGSYAEAEGWPYSYHEYNQPGRGAFKAVVFR